VHSTRAVVNGGAFFWIDFMNINVIDLYKGDIKQTQELEKYTVLMNSPPDPSWVKTHPYISGYKYIPIDKVEYLLKMIFKQFKIEVTGQGTAFNGVWVTVRVHYLHPILNEWQFHDGIGAAQIQTKKGASATDFAAINNGALSMAFPLAKTVAVKDACDHFGDLFGANLNRRDTLGYQGEQSIVATIKKTITPDDTKQWANAKAAYLRDGSLDKVLTKVDMSNLHQTQLITECKNAIS
jgi:hypothetical protein